MCQDTAEVNYYLLCLFAITVFFSKRCHRCCIFNETCQSLVTLNEQNPSKFFSTNLFVFL